MGKFTDMISGIFARSPTQKIEIKNAGNAQELISACGLNEQAARLALGDIAIKCAAWLIGGLVAKCEFRTFQQYNPLKGEEYYLWNVRPNPSQNSTQFIQEFIYRLCMNNEALIISHGGSIYVADSFYREERGFQEAIFSSISVNNKFLPGALPASQVMYFKLNNQNAASLIRNIQAGYDSMIAEATERYLKSGGEKLILKISSFAEKDKSFEEKISKYLNDYFRKYFSSKDAVLPLFEGYDVDSVASKTEKKGADEVEGIIKIKRESMDTAAQAFKIPPAILRGDVADVSVLVDNLLTFCIDPICTQVEEEICSKRYSKSEYLSGTKLSIDTTAIKHIDIMSMAANADKLIACGLYSIDDLREKIGEAPLKTKFSSEYVRTKNYAAEGGETNGN